MIQKKYKYIKLCNKQKYASKEEEINELNSKLSCLNETTNKLISSYMELKKNV